MDPRRELKQAQEVWRPPGPVAPTAISTVPTLSCRPGPRLLRRGRDRQSQRRISWCISSAPTIGSDGIAHPAGASANGKDCSPPMPPWEPTSSSKAATSSVSLQYVLLTTMSGQCSKPSVRRDVVRRIGAERRQRVLAGDRAVGQTMDPAGAECERPVLLRAHEGEADSRVVEEGGHERGIELVDALQGDPPRLAREGDQPQAPGGHDRELGGQRLVPGLTLPFASPLLAQHDLAVVPALAVHRASRAADDALGAARFGQEARDMRATRRTVPPRRRPALLRTCLRRVPRGSCRSGRGRSRPGTARGRRARRGGTAWTASAAAASIRASWRSSRRRTRERVDSLDPGVVCDLVVGEERRVADGPPRVDVADHRCYLKIALDHRAPGADQRVARRSA